MSKELEALNYLYNDLRLAKCLDAVEEVKVKSAYGRLHRALTELQAIKEAKPSKALQCLTGLEKEIIQRDGYIGAFLKIKFDNIKATLLKAEKLEKAWEIVREKDVDIFMLKRFKTLKTYNNYAKDNKTKELTQEEFELIKEMMK